MADELKRKTYDGYVAGKITKMISSGSSNEKLGYAPPKATQLPKPTAQSTSPTPVPPKQKK